MNPEPRQPSAWPRWPAWSGCQRARFYQLVGTTFPWPLYDVATRRPFYDEELQAVCLEVRRRNCGIDGKPVLFYARRPLATPVPVRKPRKAAAANDDRHADLLDGLKGLGLAGVTAAQVAEAVKELYPTGDPRRSPMGRSCGPCSCTFAARIREIMSVNNSPYQPS